MPAKRRTVVRNPEPLTEERFHAAMMESISRAIKEHGKLAVAQAMGFTTVKQLENLGKGSFPRPDRLANLRSLGPHLLDPIHREYGERSVPREAVCNTDPISAKMAALLSRMIDMERPDSDGGTSKTLSELLGLGEDEEVLRQCARKLAGLVEMIDAYRTGQKPKLVSAA